MCKYHCPSLARYLLLLGKNVFGFEAKGIARLQIDDSTCFLFRNRHKSSLKISSESVLIVRESISEQKGNTLSNYIFECVDIWDYIIRVKGN